MPKAPRQPPSVTLPEGFRAAGVACGIKPSGKPDLALLVADRPCSAAGVFTTSRFPGEPVKVTRAHLAATGGRARAIVVNAGVSNVATGQAGHADAVAMCEQVAGRVGCGVEEVLVASTGVIGPRLPMDRVERGIDAAFAELARGESADAAFARAIMTTDTVPKHARTPADAAVRVGGVAKGAGMIAPNMATMLSFLTTDATADPAALRRRLVEAADATFNRLSIDSDTSTSDMVLCLASGTAGGDAAAPDARADGSGVGSGVGLGVGLAGVCRSLCDQLAWDGEGVTRLIRLRVAGARDEAEAGQVARSVIDSPLVKCAVHGGDANWGRLIMAIGKSGADVDPAEVSISLGACGEAVRLLDKGRPATLDATRQAALDAAMQRDEVAMTIDLGQGTWWGTWTGVDLSREYVTINADYTT
jgi:glutamate N-acetyltransferase/amino-acid N-acetyltransferase